jgi:histidyl-tRNA synthetase
LRSNGIVAELYPDALKLKKQITYANKRNIPYIVLVGNQEMNSNTFTLKNMLDGSQKTLT